MVLYNKVGAECSGLVTALYVICGAICVCGRRCCSRRGLSARGFVLECLRKERFGILRSTERAGDAWKELEAPRVRVGTLLLPLLHTDTHTSATKTLPFLLLPIRITTTAHKSVPKLVGATEMPTISFQRHCNALNVSSSQAPEVITRSRIARRCLCAFELLSRRSCGTRSSARERWRQTLAHKRPSHQHTMRIAGAARRLTCLVWCDRANASLTPVLLHTHTHTDRTATGSAILVR